MTRDCLDPWRYLEISADGDLRPCCNFQPLARLDDGGSARENDAFQALRRSLLSGELQPACQRCHIRRMVPAQTLRRRVAKITPDPLAAAPLTELRIDINEKCNLRCDYCAVSSPDYRGVEMAGELFGRIGTFVAGLGPDAVINVNGHGETTYHPDWMAMCGAIIDAGHRPQIITNLAKNYSDAEIDLLARFASIQVSLDSDDDALMKTIRKSVRAGHVFDTIARIRAAAARLATRPAPHMSFSIGIYDPSIWTLERFVARILDFGIRDMTFWNLVEMQHQKLVKPLRALDAPGQQRARAILAAVRHRLEDADASYIFAGDFDAMVAGLSGPRQLRATFRRARRAIGRKVFSAR